MSSPSKDGVVKGILRVPPKSRFLLWLKKLICWIYLVLCTFVLYELRCGAFVHTFGSGLKCYNGFVAAIEIVDT